METVEIWEGQEDTVLEMESNQLHTEEIDIFHVAMVAIAYRDEMVSSTIRRQYLLHLNRAWQTATT
jgi:hypothetical protein